MAQRFGFRHSEESKQAISKAMRGESNPMHGVYGEANPSAKLTKKAGRQILNDLEEGVPTREIMNKYGISKTLVYNIKKGRHWINRLGE